ncbi:MAG: sel1 repeat family protein [Parachlamydia sp.]|nr:sel1 repeat family protein [Parachlamydia sp.]
MDISDKRKFENYQDSEVRPEKKARIESSPSIPEIYKQAAQLLASSSTEVFNQGFSLLSKCIDNLYGPAIDHLSSLYFSPAKERLDLKHVKTLAKKGAAVNSVALHHYAMMLFNGDGGQCKKEKAFNYFSQAAEKGNPHSPFYIAEMNYFGINGVVDKEKAACIYKQLAVKGNLMAAFRYGWMCLKGDGVGKNIAEGAFFYLQSCSDRNKGLLGLADFFSNGFYKDDEQALHFIRSAYERGSEEAGKRLAFKYEWGIGCTLNKTLAVEIYKDLAEKGNTEAQYKYGIMLFEGVGVEQDIEQGLKFLLLSCQNDFNRLNMIGDNYSNVQAHLLAINIYKAAAFGGSAVGMFNLYMKFKLGLGVKQDDLEADKWLFAAADLNYDLALFELGNSYSTGTSTRPIDKLAAAKVYQQLAEKGNSQAQYKYGELLLLGEGIEQNIEQGLLHMNLLNEPEKINDLGMFHFDNGRESLSFKLFQLAAKKGFLNSMWNLYCHFDQNDINHEQAEYWLKKAADLGQEDALLRWARYLYEGDEKIQANEEQAKEICKHLADHAVDPQLKLEAMHYYAMNFCQGYIERMNYLKLAADEGWPKAMYDYAKALQNGVDITYEIKRMAIRYLKMAYKKDLSFAADYLAKMYAKGRFCAKDLDKALIWTKRGAEQGSSSSKYCLAMSYYKGRYFNSSKHFDVNQNFTEARKLFEEVSTIKPRALYYLGKIYQKGLKVEIDEVQALKYYKKYNERSGESPPQLKPLLKTKMKQLSYVM